jgi:chaperonin GroES
MENNSGIIELCEYRCLVLPDPVEEKTAGGLIIPDKVREKEKHKTCLATFILRSENAFRDWGGYIPEPGDRVYVAIASGMIHEGPDGQSYRIVNDKDVLGRIDLEAWKKKGAKENA